MPMPSQSVYAARSIAMGDANHISSSQAVDFAPGTTIAMLLVCTANSITHQTNPWTTTSGSFASGAGWATDVETNGQLNLVLFGPSGGTVIGSIGAGAPLGALPVSKGQVICFAVSWSADAKTISCSINGRAIATATNAGGWQHTAPANINHTIGYAWAATGFGLDWANVIACMRLSRAVSGAELQQISAASANDNPFDLPLSNDAACTFHWNAQAHFTAGAGTSVSGGSSPVTFTVTGTPPVTDESFTLYDLRTVNFSDSAPNVAKTAGSFTWAYRTSFARYQFETDDSTIGVILASSNFSNAAGAGTPTAAGIGVTVNGGSYTAVVADRDPILATGGASIGFSGGAVSLGAAGTIRTVEITEGGQGSPPPTSVANNLGTFVVKVRIRSGRVFRPKRITPKSELLVPLTDSLGQGATAPDLVLSGAFQKARATGNYDVVNIGAGYRSIADWYSDDSTFGSLCSSIRAATPGRVPTKIYVQLSRNDFGLNRWGPTRAAGLAAYRLARKNLLLKLRAEFPLARLYVQSLGFCNDAVGTGGNGFAQTQADWLAADNGAYDDAVAAGLTNSVRTNATQSYYGAAALDPSDGIHLTAAGQATWWAAIETDLAA
jgi:lysophospholipase L1-like esterase